MIQIANMQKAHKKSVKRIAYEDLRTMTERFYFGLTLMFNNLFNFKVALCDDEVVGFISIINSRQDGLVIGNIATASKHRQKGVATLLLDSCLKSYPAGKITLQVRESNIAAQKLYAKFNFEHVDIMKNYYPVSGSFKKENGIVMVRR